jgi:hypothetical protein
MTRLQLRLLLASAALAALLLYLLIACTGLDLAALRWSLVGVRPEAFAAIVLLLGFNSFLAGEKWRLITRRLDQETGPGMPRLLYFAFTSIGVALGQVMPGSLSLVASRSVGAHLHGGRALVRGASATVLDFFFDFLVATGFALAGVLALIGGGGERSWAFLALAIGIGGFLLYGSAARLATIAARWLATGDAGRFPRFCTAIAGSPLLEPDVGRLLLAISLVRFLVLVLISAISAQAIRVDVPLWQLAAAQPFATIANVLAITPGGLGLNEWALSSALFALGTSVAVSAQLALVTRILVAAAAALGGITGVAIAAVARFSQPSRAARTPVQ